MNRSIIRRALNILLGIIIATAICPGINALAATKFWAGIDYFEDGTVEGYIGEGWVNGSGGDVLFNIGGHGQFDELEVKTATREVVIKNLIPDVEVEDAEIFINPSMIFSNYKMIFSGENDLSALIVGGSDFTIALTEGSRLTISGTTAAPAIVGNGKVKIGDKTRLILTNAAGETIINSGEMIPNDVPIEQKEYTKAEFIGLTDISGKKESASLSANSFEYTGKAFEPTVNIPGLTSGTDYTVKYENNVEVGKGKVIVEGIGKYTGRFELEISIKPIAIDKFKTSAVITGGTEFEYTGNAITPEVTITGLTVNTDYTLAYTNNIDPGMATITVTGTGKYGGSFTLEFKIKSDEKKYAEVKDDAGSDYTINTTGETSEATYDAAKSKNEKTVKIPDTVTLPDGSKVKVTSIARNACKGNKKLTKATIGNNVKEIGDNAFNGCSKLTNLKFGKKVEKIGNGAVRKCKSLKNVTIPASTKTIGKNAFDGDSNLKTITINCKNLKSVGKNAIRNIHPNAVIKLKGTAKQKKAAEKLITKKGTGYKKTMKIKK